MPDKPNDSNNRDDSSRSHALTGSVCRVQSISRLQIKISEWIGDHFEREFHKDEIALRMARVALAAWDDDRDNPGEYPVTAANEYNRLHEALESLLEVAEPMDGIETLREACEKARASLSQNNEVRRERSELS